jgi:hypothetical protein
LLEDEATGADAVTGPADAAAAGSAARSAALRCSSIAAKLSVVMAAHDWASAPFDTYAGDGGTDPPGTGLCGVSGAVSVRGGCARSSARIPSKFS